MSVPDFRHAVVAYANMESLSEHSPVSRYEPAPLQFVTRLSWYPWLVVGVTCIGGFIGQRARQVMGKTLDLNQLIGN